MKHQLIITAPSAGELNRKMEELTNKGYTPVGSHHVVESFHQLVYAGMQHKRTEITLEYSQTMMKEE